MTVAVVMTNVRKDLNVFTTNLVVLDFRENGEFFFIGFRSYYSKASSYTALSYMGLAGARFLIGPKEI